MIRQQTIDQIFSAANIEEVVGDYVKLKRSGSGLGGLCPFHNEKTPSFKVSPHLGIYKCFGCGKGGNVVDFVMDVEKMTYPEALRHLANRYHIEIEEDNSNQEELSEQVKLRDSLFVAMEYAGTYFHDVLLNHEEGRSIGHSYFVHRGINPSTMEEFRLGYALNSWDAFSGTAVKMGYDVNILARAGLIKFRNEENHNDGHYDVYRERVIFPIRNLSGKIIGLGGRHLKKDAKSPKYINSPENEIYHKSAVLYGLYESRKEIRTRDKALLVEGYLDVIMLYQSGLKNVVATSGTALTTDQVKLVKRFTDNVTLLYDGDKAGIRAAMRGVDLLLEGGLNVRVVVFPDGEDPDSWCRKVGGEEMEKFISANEKDFVLFKTEMLLAERGEDPVAKSETARDVVASIAKITDPIKRSAYIRETSNLLQFDEELLLAEAKRQRNEIQKQRGRREREESEQISFIQPGLPIEPPREEDLQFRERALINTLIRFGDQPYSEDVDVAGYIFSELDHDEYVFENADLGEAFLDAKKFYGVHGNLTEEFYTRHKILGKMAANILSLKYELSPNWGAVHEIFVKTDNDNYQNEVIANLNYLKLYKIDSVLKRTMKDMEAATEDDEVVALQMRIFKIREIKRTITDILGIEGAMPE
ncbi:MAG: DNA primase [Flavobacteriales bacterium]|nr:DNA primase [Bacteroidota bacterium]MCB9241164.1 DNA primase [Flavobacteriales bacterium]